jgi:hypothetical protein
VCAIEHVVNCLNIARLCFSYSLDLERVAYKPRHQTTHLHERMRFLIPPQLFIYMYRLLSRIVINCALLSPRDDTGNKCYNSSETKCPFLIRQTWAESLRGGRGIKLYAPDYRAYTRISQYDTEQIAIAVLLRTSTSELICYNLSWGIGYSEIFRRFPQSNAVILSQLDHCRFLPDPYQFVSHPTVRRYRVLILTVSLNKQLGRINMAVVLGTVYIALRFYKHNVVRWFLETDIF